MSNIEPDWYDSKEKIWKMNFNISTSTTAVIANETRDSKLFEYDGEYSDYYYSGKVQIDQKLNWKWFFNFFHS